MLNNLIQIELLQIEAAISKRAIQKTKEVPGDLTENKIADKITRI